MRKVNTGGGWAAIVYTLRTARRAGGIRAMWRALRTKNACKTCAFGMGGQRGGMVDERRSFPEICKKSVQAMAADMQGPIPPEFFERNGFDALRRLTPRELEHAGRLVQPLYAGPQDAGYRPIEWDDAIERCVALFRKTKPNENFFYVSGRSSNEAGFILQLFARLFGTNNVNNCSYYCHQASGVGLSSVFGSGTATILREDLDRCDLVFVIGGNPASNHPRLMRALMELRRRGGEVVVINPMVETGLVNFSVPSDARSLLFGSAIASEYVQPHIGGDIALLCGIAKRIEELGAHDEAFLHHCVEDWDAMRDHVRALSWERITEASGVKRGQIERVAEIYAASERTVFSWTMGITHHRHGTDNVRAIANLALLRGMIGKPGAGLLPIRGHSNVQGIGSVGVTPALKKALYDGLEKRYGIELPREEGLDSMACMHAAKSGAMRSAWCLGGNFYGANPDARGASEAIGCLDSIVYLSTTLNTGHAHGRAKETLILPVLARDEEPQPTTQESMFSFVRLSEGGEKRLDGPRSEVEIIAGLARRVLGDDGPVDWSLMEQHKNIRQAIAAVVPGYEKLARIDETRAEFQIGGRTLHRPAFNTPTGKARMHVTQIPELETANDELRLMTVRSEGQFNTVVYEEHDLYRHQDRRDVILMNEADVHRFGLAVNERVTVRSATGEMSGIHVRVFGIRAGSAAMYGPEANVLVPTDVDPESRTPAFKSVTITLEREPR